MLQAEYCWKISLFISLLCETRCRYCLSQSYSWRKVLFLFWLRFLVLSKLSQWGTCPTLISVDTVFSFMTVIPSPCCYWEFDGPLRCKTILIGFHIFVTYCRLPGNIILSWEVIIDNRIFSRKSKDKVLELGLMGRFAFIGPPFRYRLEFLLLFLKVSTVNFFSGGLKSRNNFVRFINL